MEQLLFCLTDKYAETPARKLEEDSGLDIKSCEDKYIPPRGWAKIHTGVCARIPKGYELQVRPRSGLAANGIVAAFGTVDRGYTGEICVTVYNNMERDSYHVQIGDRVAQLVLAPVVTTDCEVKTIANEEFEKIVTERGGRGFGSTGK